MSDLVLIVFYILTFTAIFTTIYGSLQREANHSLYVILLSLAITFFGLGSLLVLASNNAETAFIGFRIQHIGLPFIGGLWFLYSIDICGYSIKREPLVVLLMVLPVVVCLGVTSGDPMGLFIRSLTYDHSGAMPFVRGDFTPFYIAGLAHVYGFNLGSGILIFHKLSKTYGQTRMRLIFHLFAGLFPFLTGVIATIVDGPYKREFVSAVLCISSAILNLYLHRTGAFKVVTKAKYQLFESVQDGIVIVNKKNEYMDANDRAKLIFPVLTETERGAPIKTIEGFTPISTQTSDHGNKFTVTTDDISKHYTITRSELLEDSQYIGSTFMIYDITELEELTVKLQELATTDDLTQVNNRRNFFSLAEGMIATMVRLNIDVCVAMLDIDNFKVVNDTYGHPFGDEVLKAVATRCKSLLRQSDILGRYGGEEFGIVYYGMDPNSVKRRLEHLRQSVSELELYHGEEKVGITVSIGFSFVDYNAEKPLEHAISQADFALYQAKQSGRNRVCSVVNNRIDV